MKPKLILATFSLVKTVYVSIIIISRRALTTITPIRANSFVRLAADWLHNIASQKRLIK